MGILAARRDLPIFKQPLNMNLEEILLVQAILSRMR